MFQVLSQLAVAGAVQPVALRQSALAQVIMTWQVIFVCAPAIPSVHAWPSMICMMHDPPPYSIMACCVLRPCELTPGRAYLSMACRLCHSAQLRSTRADVKISLRLASQVAQPTAQLAAKTTRLACSQGYFDGTLPAGCCARVAGDGPHHKPAGNSSSKQISEYVTKCLPVLGPSAGL
jgi:hypothetical protein